METPSQNSFGCSEDFTYMTDQLFLLLAVFLDISIEAGFVFTCGQHETWLSDMTEQLKLSIFFS